MSTLQDQVVPTHRKIRGGYYLLFCAWLFLFVEYALRISDSVILPQLSRAFHIQAAGIGVLSSTYYIAYVLMQIPAGILLDRFGIRRALLWGVLSVAAGTFLMGVAHYLSLAIFARFLMGFGSAFAFIASISIVYTQLKSKFLSFWIGISMTVATLGAASGQAPWYWFVERVGDWRMAYYLVGAALLVIALLMTLAVSPKLSERRYPNAGNIKKAFSIFIQRKRLWLLMAFVGLLSAPITAFVALWGIPFFVQGLGWSREMAASLMAASWIGGLLGGPVLGYCADRFHFRKGILVLAGILASFFMAIILWGYLSVFAIACSLFILGILCNANVIVFSIMAESASKKATGFMCGLTNMFNMSGGPIFQLLIGFFLSTQMLHVINTRAIYSLASYQEGLMVIPVLLFLMSVCVGFFYTEL